jgi:hypothetical protein
MLNLEENLRMFGPIRNFWDALDEKAVQRIKRAFLNVNMTSKRWLATLLENVTRDQYLRILWDRKLGSHLEPNSFSKTRVIRESSLSTPIESKRPITAMFHDERFYVVYRIGGACSEKVMMKQVSVSTIKVTKGSVDYYRTQLDEDGTAIDYTIFTKSAPNVCHCLFLPYLAIDGNDSEENEDCNFEERNETRNSDLFLASIIDFQHHKLFDGSAFMLPEVWSASLDGSSSEREASEFVDSGDV